MWKNPRPTESAFHQYEHHQYSDHLKDTGFLPRRTKINSDDFFVFLQTGQINKKCKWNRLSDKIKFSNLAVILVLTAITSITAKIEDLILLLNRVWYMLETNG